MTTTAIRDDEAGVSRPRDHAGLEILTYDECLDRLRSQVVGRIAFVHAGAPLVLPVNYGMSGTSVLFRTAPGTKLDTAIMGREVAFEVDHFDAAQASGWSVVIRGTADTVDEDDLSEAEREIPEPWAREVERTHWVRIRPDEITGRRIPR